MDNHLALLKHYRLVNFIKIGPSSVKVRGVAEGNVERNVSAVGVHADASVVFSSVFYKVRLIVVAVSSAPLDASGVQEVHVVHELLNERMDNLKHGGHRFDVQIKVCERVDLRAPPVVVVPVFRDNKV